MRRLPPTALRSANYSPVPYYRRPYRSDNTVAGRIVCRGQASTATPSSARDPGLRGGIHYPPLERRPRQKRSNACRSGSTYSRATRSVTKHVPIDPCAIQTVGVTIKHFTSILANFAATSYFDFREHSLHCCLPLFENYAL